MDQNKKTDQSGNDQASRTLLTEEEKAHVRHRVNARIAHWCSFAALVIILIDFAAFVIGQEDLFWMAAGVMLSIALLAIAMLNNPTNSNK